MSFYNYKAKNLFGEELSGRCWDSSKGDLIKSLRDKGFYLIYYEKALNKQRKLILRKSSSKDLSLFCSYFSSILAAGINIAEALSILYSEISNKSIKKSLYEIKDMVLQGEELSSSMKDFSHIYPKFLINMIRVGEKSGKLDSILLSLSKFYDEENKIKNKISKSLTYPIIVFITSIIIMEILIIYIIPVFIKTILSLGGSVPIITTIVVSTLTSINNNLPIFIGVMVITFFILRHNNKLSALKSLVDKFFIESKLTKKFISRLTAVRFSRSMGVLMQSGVQITEAFQTTCDVIENEYAKLKLKECIEEIKGGRSISESLSSTKIFPLILYSMVRVGEETGSLDYMLLKASDIMEGELYNSIESFTALIEPAMIITLSLFIGIILVSLVIPMFNIMDYI